MENNNLSIYLLSSTHWDREWYQTFQGFRYRLVPTTNEIIETLESNPEFGVFHFDGQTIVLEDFLEIEPDKKERLAELIRKEKLVIGPWYVMPDEFLLSGESLIRNLMKGHKIAREWGVEAWKYGYICDIFGHIAQMPQIFNGFGIKYALLGRGTNEHTTPAHFIWKAPDGSECITFKLQDEEGYCAFTSKVYRGHLDSGDLDIKIKEYIEYEMKRSEIPVVLLMDGFDHEKIHEDSPKLLKNIHELYPHADIHHVSLVEMGKELEKYRTGMMVRSGELNETAKLKGSYAHLISHTLSSRYPVKKANDECQTLLEKWVEPLTAVAELNGFSIQKIYVDLAYKFLMQNHPHDSICGCSIDQVHKDMEYRFDQTKVISTQIIEDIMNFNRNQHLTEKDGQTRILLLWNPLPFCRKEVITVDIDFNKDYKKQYQEPFGYEVKNSFRIFDHSGKEVPYGLVSIKKNYNIRRYNQFVEKVDMYTLSLEVEMPAMGTAEYKIVPCEEASRYLDCMSKSEQQVENEYISLKVNDNGTLSIFDKVSNRIYDQMISYVDDGEIGDGWYHANPVEDRVVASFGSECTIERVENGPSRTVFKVTNYMKVPNSMDYYVHGIRRSENYVTLKICSLIGLSIGSKAVDIETFITNTVRDHRVRLKLPTKIKSSSYFANQPFTFVERKPGINFETQDWKECEVLEKQMNGIVGRRNEDGSGLAFISAHGLHECAVLDDDQGTMLVTLYRSFGKTFMTNGEEGGQILEDLTFKYSIMPISSETGYADLIRLQDVLQTGVKTTACRVTESYVLPEAQSFFEVVGKDICLSVLKKPENEDKNAVVVRLFNMSNNTADASIRCFKEIKGVEEVNLNEEYIDVLKFKKYMVNLKMKAWSIKTLYVKF